MFDLFKATILGIVEGLTEFLPVSSTGHLLLLEHFFGFDDDDFGKTFAILIQLGAILALLSIYFTRLWALATGFSWLLGEITTDVATARLPQLRKVVRAIEAAAEEKAKKKAERAKGKGKRKRKPKKA